MKEKSKLKSSMLTKLEIHSYDLKILLVKLNLLLFVILFLKIIMNNFCMINSVKIYQNDHANCNIINGSRNIYFD